MRIIKEVKSETTERVTEKLLCDNCEKEIPCADACGFGQDYTLNNSWCKQCGGKSWDFCSLECLKEFVNNKLEKK